MTAKYEEPKDTKTYYIGKWIVDYSESQKTLKLYSPLGYVFIIKTSTYEFRRIPKYVLKELWRLGLLNFWKESQIGDSLKRLEAVRKRFEDIDSGHRDNVWVNAP